MAKNKTPFLELNDWVGTDQIKREELNGNFRKLDDKIKEHETSLAEKAKLEISATDKAYGAKADGVTDDSQALFNLHTYANSIGAKVKYPKGTYFIGQMRNIPIKTSVDFGEAILVFDESKALGGYADKSWFSIDSTQPLTDILTSIDKTALLSQWKRGASSIPALATYENKIVFVENNNDILVKRTNGLNYHRKDKVFIDRNGAVSGDICFTFSDFTSVKVKDTENHYIKLTGGTFELTGVTSTLVSRGTYYGPIFNIKRCRTVLENMIFKLKNGNSDSLLDPTMGCWSTNYVYDLEFNNIRVFPREKDREGTANDVASGTYGFVFFDSMNVRMKNVFGMADGDMYWGVMQSEYLKDFYAENCRLKRVDAHVWGYNFYVTNCKLGDNGISLYGGGDLIIKDTTVNAGSSPNPTFVRLREDFGCTWDGDVVIENGRLICGNGDATSRMRVFQTYHDDSWDFGHDLVLFRNIKIKNFIFDLTNKTNTGEAQTLIYYSLPNAANNVYMPKTIELDSIRMRNRDKGVSLLDISRMESMKVNGTGNPSDYPNFVENASVIIRSCQTLSDYTENFTVSLQGTSSSVVYASDSYLPKVDMDGVQAKVNISHCKALLLFKNGVLRQLKTEDASHIPIVRIKDSDIRPTVRSTGGERMFKNGLTTKLGHFLLKDCMLHTVYVDGVQDLTEANGMTKYNIFTQKFFNGWIKGCKVSKDVVDSNCFSAKGQGGTMGHQTYLEAFETTDYQTSNIASKLKINDAQPQDGLFYRWGEIIWSTAYNGSNARGWFCKSSGNASTGNTNFYTL